MTNVFLTASFLIWFISTLAMIPIAALNIHSNAMSILFFTALTFSVPAGIYLLNLLDERGNND